jgi:hypothetical protein
MNGDDRQGRAAPGDHVPGLHRASAQLREIAAVVDRASAVLDPAIELVEASYAIHRALVLLADWRASRDVAGPMPATTARWDHSGRCDRDLSPDHRHRPC